MRLKVASEKEFKDIDCARRIISHDHPRKFAFLEIDESHGSYGLSWRSDIIEPVIVNETCTIWVGVDQQLVAISKSRGNIIFALQLSSNLVDIANNNSKIAALTESELLIFNNDGSLSQIKALPEIGSGLSVSNEGFCVEMIDGEKLNI
jgi:hypothetical protein